MAKSFLGVVVYEIIRSADTIILNGIYTNNGDGGPRDRPYEVNNEIAKKKLKESDGIPHSDYLVGTYQLRYIDATLVNGELEITVQNEAYHIVWRRPIGKKLSDIFIGIGVMAGNKHLAVSYQNA